MAKIVLADVGGIIDSLRLGVERRLGRRRRLYTGEDLIDDVGLSEDQFEQLIDELEEELSVEIDPDTLDQLTVAGALLVRLVRLCSRPIEKEGADRAAA